MAREIRFDAFVDPDIAMSYRDLPDPFTTRVPIGITNSEMMTLWFRSTLVGPPAGYSNYTTDLGSIGPGSSAVKIATFDRARPTVRTTDSLTMRIQAYEDAGYTILYGQQDLSLQHHLFDHNALTLVDHDDFDAGSTEGWSVWQTAWDRYCEVNPTHYLTAPYSCAYRCSGSLGGYNFWAGIRKNFGIGAVTRAFLVIHLKRILTGDTQDLSTRLYVAGTLKVPEKVMPPVANWYRLCHFMTPNQTNEVRIQIWHNRTARYRTVEFFIDEVWVVTE